MILIQNIYLSCTIFAIIAVIFLYYKKYNVIILCLPIFIYGCLTLGIKGENIDDNIHNFEGIVVKISENHYGKKLILKETEIDKIKVGKIIVNVDKKENVAIFSTISGKLKLIKMSQAVNQGNFDELRYYRSENIFNKAKIIKIESSKFNFINKMLNGIYEHINRCIEKIDSIEVKSLYKILILGHSDKNINEIKQIFSILGISHILAISGMHINLIFIIISKLFIYFGINRKIALTIQLFLIFIYIQIISMPVSAMRAYVMIFIATISIFLKRSYDEKTALGIAAIYMLLINVYVVENIGFILSFGITLLLMIVNDMDIGRISKYILFSYLIIPLIGFIFYKIPTFFMITSFIFVPISTLILVTGFSSVLISLVSGVLTSYILFVGKATAAGMLALGKFLSTMEVSTLIIGKQGLIKFAAVYVIIFLTFRYINKKILRISISIILLIIFVINVKTSDEYVVLDVGQGDCNILRENGNLIMVDCGSNDVKNVGKYRVIPYLDYIGVRKIDYIFLTHMHSDHYNGMIELMESGRVKNIVITFYGVPTEQYYRIIALAEKNDIKVYNIYAGEKFKYGGISIECMHPSRNYCGDNPNSYSMVLDAELNDKKILLTGDLEEKEENAILSKLDKVDILKVGHHGSNTSSSEKFIEKIRPDFAAISCGAKNKFGHPSKKTIENLDKRNINIDITKKYGQIIYKLGYEITRQLPMKSK